jgi:hypothetical protein
MTFVGLKKRGGQGVDLSTEVISDNDPTLLQLTKSRFDCWCRSRRGVGITLHLLLVEPSRNRIFFLANTKRLDISQSSIRTIYFYIEGCLQR